MFLEIAEHYEAMGEEEDDQWFVDLNINVQEISSVYNNLAK